ncbi:MAG: hypothetical protein GX987_07905 [Tissierellia bacterium]|nr:hypothetical protein [Tissierellia bacterium]
MYDGYNKIFWGIFIATFNIKLGMIKILPAFIGFMIILSGISSLYRETNIEPFNKAKTFSIILIIGTGIGELMGLLSIEPTNFFIFNEIWIVFNIIMEMLMFYKCFEGSIEYFNVNNYENLAEENIKKVRFYIIALTIDIIFLNFALIFDIRYLNTIVAIMIIILRIYLMVLTYRFRNVFTE